MDVDGLKIYCISYSGDPVNKDAFSEELQALKGSRDIAWSLTPGYAIFHEGSSARYLVLIYWGNDNEIFPLVSVETKDGWLRASDKYSFCLWDLEVMWHERQLYIEHCYSGKKDLAAYRLARPGIWVTSKGTGRMNAPVL
jgi:hypothetical protein